MNSIRVLLVDDHTVVRRGLRRVLESTGSIQVVGEVGTGGDAVQATASLRPDVVVMDVGLPDINGIEATRRVLATDSDAKVLMLSMHADQEYMRQSLVAGAKGYVLKDLDEHELVTAIVAISRGDTAFVEPSSGDCCGPDVLSRRERQVLALIGAGQNNGAVANQLGISINTVETHRKHIIEKLDLHSTAELVRYAIRHGLTS